MPTGLLSSVHRSWVASFGRSMVRRGAWCGVRRDAQGASGQLRYAWGLPSAQVPEAMTLRWTPCRISMLFTRSFALALLAFPTLLHEVLRGLGAALPVLRIPARSKRLVVLSGAFCAHATEITLYALAYDGLVNVGHLG